MVRPSLFIFAMPNEAVRRPWTREQQAHLDPGFTKDVEGRSKAPHIRRIQEIRRAHGDARCWNERRATLERERSQFVVDLLSNGSRPILPSLVATEIEGACAQVTCTLMHCRSVIGVPRR